ncbi:muts domain V-domain-containing protein [Mycena capillaripes]|nr:muts domain V-domain-containing protein [Mycena capillaripes]
MSGGTPSSSPSRQVKISTFFSSSHTLNKRPVSGRDDSPEPPLKKRKATKAGLSESIQPTASSSKGRAERWRFSLSSPEKSALVTHPETIPRPSNREALKTKLLSANDASVASKTREQVSGGIDSPLSGSDSDHAFEEISEYFSAKSGKGQRKKAVRKPAEEIGPSGETYTPLEKQVARLKKDNPSVLLMIEVGYKYKFFGEDAKVAAKELGMVCFTDRNFLVASIPTHRRDIHLKKLLSQGYKVGIVQQIETAALKKAGDNRNAPFERKLVHLFTAATYVDDLDSIDELDKYAAPRLVCIIEGNSDKSTGVDVCIGMVSVSPSVGDVVWDVFDDSPMRIELETRLVHSKPTELLLQRNGLSKSTDKMLKHFTEVPATATRTEYFDDAMSFSEAFEFVSQFYANSSRHDSGAPDKSLPMAAIADLPKPVVVALACTIRYLSAFDIAATLSQTTFFTKFSTTSHMLLTANTLANLEIFQNETDYTTRGSLIWILDKTVTSFGARMLRSWIGKPLVSKSELQLRIESVEEIIESSSDKLVSLRQVLKKLPDLAKGLCRIQYKQCTPQELVVLLSAFHKIGNAFAAIQTSTDVGLKSKLLNDIILSLPPLKKPMGDLLNVINLKQAAEGKKEFMWRDSSKYPLVEDNILAIQQVEVELDQELVAIRKTLKMPSLKWSTVGGEEYLIEVKKSDKRPIPASYHPAISKTKYIERYRSPEVTRKLQERARWQESLQIEAKKAFLDFLDEVTAHYAILRDAVNKLAIADCLLSLAQVALRDNYVKPQFTESATFEIIEGRHPMVEALRSDPFVPNSVLFSEDGRSKVITGPNMGGKSSCVRMIALIAIMAQIGSYVPAKSVKLGMLDSVLTRMGAQDEIARGRSTFMVEMTETSEILHAATSNSLVILDELGRGTSTFDGMAIAYAVLNQLVALTQCKTLFITHYPLVAMELETKFPGRVQNIHVGYSTETRGIDGRRDVTFLYRLTNGIAPESFGVECARLAGLPESILDTATKESSKMESLVAARAKRNTSLKRLHLLKDLLQCSSRDEREATVEKLHSLLRGKQIVD